MFRWLIVTALSLFALTQAIIYSSIWESQTHPVENVTVVIEGETYKGALSTTWDRAKKIKLDDGRVVKFHNYGMMSYPMPTEKGEDFLYRWRSIVPVYLCFLVVFLIGFWNLRAAKKINLDPKSF